MEYIKELQQRIIELKEELKNISAVHGNQFAIINRHTAIVEELDYSERMIKELQDIESKR
jgi:hypothetical protein